MELTTKMSTQVGLVSSLQGTAVVIKSSGEVIPLKVDSPFFEGDQITVKGQDAKAVITTNQNQDITVIEGTPATVSQSAIEQVEQLQAEILKNDDFDFNELESTAAGSQTLTSPSSPLIIEPSENTIEYHSNANSLNNSQQSDIDTTNTTTKNFSNENNLVDPSSTIIGQSFANVTEDFQNVFQGKIETNSSFTPNSLDTNYGTISYDEQGNWQYSLNNQLSNIQELGAGDTLTDNISLTAQNGGTFLVEVTINGSNDQASISGKTSEVVTEDDNSDLNTQTVEISGNLNIIDIDSGEAGFIAESQIKTTYGNAEINAEGQWHYTLNNSLSSVQSLTSENQLTDFFNVRSLDGATETIQITIQGTNDTPLLSGTNEVALNLDTSETVSGQLGINDPDFGESHFQANTNILGNFGIGSIEENGQRSYQVDTNHPEISNLDPDTLLHDSFVVSTADGTEQTIIIPISNNPNTTSIASNDEHTSEASAIIELSDNDNILALNTNQEHNASSDLYIWNADNDETSSPDNTDSIAQFSLGSGGDILQLNDLLLESSAEDQLDQFLHFSYDGKDTTIEINTNQDNSDHHFVILNNMDLTAIGNTDGEIIQQLIQQGNLDIACL